MRDATIQMDQNAMFELTLTEVILRGRPGRHAMISATLEDCEEPTARRVFGGAHPLTSTGSRATCDTPRAALRPAKTPLIGRGCLMRHK